MCFVTDQNGESYNKVGPFLFKLPPVCSKIIDSRKIPRYLSICKYSFDEIHIDMPEWSFALCNLDQKAVMIYCTSRLASRKSEAVILQVSCKQLFATLGGTYRTCKLRDDAWPVNRGLRTDMI